MGKKEREDEPTKDFKKSVKDVDKLSKKEKKRLDKIVKRPRMSIAFGRKRIVDQ